MHESRDLNNPKRIFEEKGDIEPPKAFVMRKM